ncbi:hypothetical protein CDD81_4528 [Ophiocordyceps australis]|uniref:Tyrosine specific protein phosphatases domain-containing protein n=1 Tax=Ophiocordyceps australis TaxID=1399860 RepID=A0A2C5YA04_9HYPO|nr:hypothetical protein CDD81_4528 [Ophiocordyceps australis]
MERMSGLRRKPKPPAIETSMERPSKNTIDVVADAQRHSPVMARRHLGGLARKTASPFRGLKVRPAARRARPPSPPSDQPWSPPPAPAFGHDGPPPCPVVRVVWPGSSGQPSPRPDMPAFLQLSNQEIDAKFHEITWTERLRLADAHQNRVVHDYKWGHHQLSDTLTALGIDRYSNIKPWNWNRVRLKVPPHQLDYVNASLISLSSMADASLPPLRYIAMQGPTEPSVHHVWRMVAEQQSSPAVIVQLTTMVEGGAPKCHQYFPHGQAGASWTLNQNDEWGDGWAAQLTLDSVQASDDGAIEVCKLLLHVQGEHHARTVWHLLYRQWPDFGVPALHDLDTFFDLMRLSREYSEPATPRIVHCSAGVGRTGTFICLEYLMRELNAGAFSPNGPSTSSVDAIYMTVEHLRQQRRAMVQAEIQFRFIYAVMRRLWCHKYGVSEDNNQVQANSAQGA